MRMHAEHVYERTFDQMAGLHHVRVRMVDGHIEAERLQQHILVEHQVLRLLLECGRTDFRALGDALRGEQRLDDGLDLARLFLDFGRQEQAGRCNAGAMEYLERVEHVEPMHVHDGRVDA